MSTKTTSWLEKKKNFHQRSTYARVLFKFFLRLSINFEIIQCHKKPKVASRCSDENIKKKVAEARKKFYCCQNKRESWGDEKVLLFFSVSINFRYKSICRMGVEWKLCRHQLHTEWSESFRIKLQNVHKKLHSLTPPFETNNSVAELSSPRRLGQMAKKLSPPR